MRFMTALVLASLGALPAQADILVAGSGSCAEAEMPGRAKATAMAVTVTAADGPMSGTRAAIDAASSAGIPVAWILIEGTALVDDAELLLFIETEMRDLVAAAGATGPIVTAMGDSLGTVLNAVLFHDRALPEGTPCRLDHQAFKDLITVGR